MAVARRGHHDRATTTRKPERRQHVRDLRRLNVGGELEAEVDHVGAPARRVADGAGDHCGVTFAEGVEHAKRHDLRAVGDARGADPVVRGLGDRARHVCAMTELVVRMAITVDEVPPLHERACVQVGCPAKALVPLVGDSAVEHGDHGACSAGGAAGRRELPGLGHVDAEEVGQVPLAPESRIVGDERRGASPPVRHRVRHSRVPVKLGDRLAHRVAVLDG
jgi:hypothetical protein